MIDMSNIFWKYWGHDAKQVPPKISKMDAMFYCNDSKSVCIKTGSTMLSICVVKASTIEVNTMDITMPIQLV